MKRSILIKLSLILSVMSGMGSLDVTASDHQHMPAHDMSGHDMSGHDMSGHDMPAHDMSAHDMSDQQGDANLASQLNVLEPWIRLTPPVAKNGAAYFVLHNTGKEDVTVVGVSTPLAEMAAMHDSVEHKGMMSMKHLMSLSIPAGEKVEFAPGGRHLMLINLTEILEAGKEFPVYFKLQNGATVNAMMVVK